MNLFKIILLFFSVIKLNAFKMHVINTAILSFMPELKLHHVVVLSNDKDIHTIDLSPINQNIDNLCKLLLGINIPAQVRFRTISNIDKSIDINLDNNIINEWIKMNNIDIYKSQELSNECYNNINDIEIKTFLDDFNLYDCNMNLYTNNCQHFSKKLKNKFLIKN